MAIIKKSTPLLHSEILELRKEVALLKKSNSKNSLNTVWESFFKNSEKIIMLVDKNARIIDINNVVRGLKRSEVIGRSVYEFVGKESIAKTKAAITKVFKTGNLQKYEIIALADNGLYAHYSCKATPHIINKKVVAAIIDVADITEQVRLKNELEKSEEKFKKLSNLAFEGVAIHQNGKVVGINKAVQKTFNYSEKEILGESILKFVHPDYHQTVINNVKNNYEKSYEIIMLKKGNIPFWAQITGNTSATYHGQPARATVIRDISVQKANEEKAKESERKFSVLIDNFPGIAYRCKLDKKLTMLYLSKGFEKLTGYKPHDFINNKKIAFNDIVFSEDQGNKNLKRALKTKSVYELEYRIITAKKEIKWVWEKGEGVFDDKGKLLFLEGFIADIHDKKSATIELTKSREDYKNLIQKSPDGILLYINNKINFANTKAIEMLETTFDKIQHNSRVFYLMPQYQKFADQRIEALNRGEDVPYAEFQMKTEKGKIIEIESKPTLINYDGRLATLVIMHDQTTQKQLLKEQLRLQISEEANKKLQKEINERRKTEEILQTNQSYTQLLIESSLDIICATNKEGKITEFNTAAEKTFGYKRKEVIGKHVKILYANPNESTFITQEELYGKGFYVGEVNNKTKSGKLFISFLSANVLKDSSGEIVGAMGVSRNITELKKAEQELRDSEEKYRDLFENATDLIQSVSAEGKINYINSAWKKTLGYSDNEINGKSIFKFIHPESIVHCENLFAQILKGKSLEYVELKFLTKEGKAIPCEGNINVKKVNNKVVSTRGIFRDITERIKNESEKQTQTAKLRAVLESGSHLIWSIDSSFSFSSFNRNFAYLIKKFLGLDISIGDSATEGKINMSKERKEFWIKQYSRAFGGNHLYFEVKYQDKENNIIWYEIYLNPIVDDKKKVVEVSAIAHDITETKLASETIKQSLQEKEVLLKEVHHRVKNNLQVISSILNLQSSYVKDEATIALLKESQNRIKSMAFIHESLYQNKDFTNVNFSDYAVSLAKNLLYSQSVTQQKIKLICEVQTIFLNLDLAIPLGLVINELITNAIKYAFVNSNDNNTITLEMKYKDGNVHLLIADNGVGIPASVNYRDTKSLGLQLVTTLTDQLNGTIELDKTKGTNFTIIFKQNQIKPRI